MDSMERLIAERRRGSEFDACADEVPTISRDDDELLGSFEEDEPDDLDIADDEPEMEIGGGESGQS